MQHRFWTSVAAAALLSVGIGVGAQAEQPKAESEAVPKTSGVDLASANNGFGLKLFREVHRGRTNTLVSPLSVSTALQLASEGARGETKDEMREAMGIAKLDVPGSYRELADLLKAQDDVVLRSANSIWVDSGFTLREEFGRTSQESFDAKVQSLSFRDPAALKLLNGWVSDKTEGKIPSLLERMPDGGCVLVNAVYFKGTWHKPFDLEETRQEEFRKADGAVMEVPMMHCTRRMKYCDEGGLAVRLPFGEKGKAGLWAVLPKEGETLDELVESLTAEQVAQWQQNARWERVALGMPRFEMRFRADLTELRPEMPRSSSLTTPLRELGIKKAFEKGADFGGLVSGDEAFFIEQVVHEAVLEVDEKGAEAAAATAVKMKNSADAPGEPVAVTCDRPFLVLIVDDETGSILFVGAVHNPESKK